MRASGNDYQAALRHECQHAERLWPIAMLRERGHDIPYPERQSQPNRAYKVYDLNRVRELAALGKPAREIAAMIGCDPGHLGKVCRREGIQLTGNKGKWPAHPERDAQIMALRNEGLTCIQIADRIRTITPKGVESALRRMRVQSLRRAPSDADVRRMYKAGKSGQQIAKKLGFAPTTINRRIRAMGLRG